MHTEEHYKITAGFIYTQLKTGTVTGLLGVSYWKMLIPTRAALGCLAVRLSAAICYSGGAPRLQVLS